MYVLWQKRWGRLWLKEPAQMNIANSSSGSRQVVTYFRHSDPNGKRVRLPIGAYDGDGTTGLTLKDARQRARQLSDLYLSGITDLRAHLEGEQARRRRCQGSGDPAASP